MARSKRVSSRPLATANPWGVDQALVPAVSKAETMLEDVLDHGRELRVVSLSGLEHLVAATQEVAIAGLDHRVLEAAVGCPTVHAEDAGVVGPEQGLGLGVAATRADPVRGRRLVGGDPQPSPLSSHFP